MWLAEVQVKVLGAEEGQHVGQHDGFVENHGWIWDSVELKLLGKENRRVFWSVVDVTEMNEWLQWGTYRAFFFNYLTNNGHGLGEPDSAPLSSWRRWRRILLIYERSVLSRKSQTWVKMRRWLQSRQEVILIQIFVVFEGNRIVRFIILLLSL